MGCRGCAIPCCRLVRTRRDISSSFAQDQTSAPKIPFLWPLLGCKSLTSTAGAFGGKHPAPANFDAPGMRHSRIRGSHPRAENPLQKQNFGISGVLPPLAQCHRRGQGLFLHSAVPRAPFWLWISSFGTLGMVAGLGADVDTEMSGGRGWCGGSALCRPGVMLPLLPSLDFGVAITPVDKIPGRGITAGLGLWEFPVGRGSRRGVHPCPAAGGMGKVPKLCPNCAQIHRG